MGFFRNVGNSIVGGLHRRVQIIAAMFGVMATVGSVVHLTDLVNHERSGVATTAVVVDHNTECSITITLSGGEKKTQPADCVAGRQLVREHGSKKIDFREQRFVTMRYRTADGQLVDSRIASSHFNMEDLDENRPVSIVYDPNKPSVVRPQLSTTSIRTCLEIFLIGLASLAFANIRRLMRYARGGY